MEQSFSVMPLGHVKVVDKTTGEIVVDKKNAVHPQNMALAIARALSRDNTGSVFKMSFGNGGTFLNSANQLVYRTPNIIGQAELYNKTYEVQVDEQAAGTPISNSTFASQSPNPSISSIITIVAELGPSDPIGQLTSDTNSANSDFRFDEIALKTSDNMLISHVIFNPWLKTANRSFLVTYTLTISVS